MFSKWLPEFGSPVIEPSSDGLFQNTPGVFVPVVGAVPAPAQFCVLVGGVKPTSEPVPVIVSANRLPQSTPVAATANNQSFIADSPPLTLYCFWFYRAEVPPDLELKK